MRVVFLGSPDFAVASLAELLKSSHEVVGVVSQPDRPAGRGLSLKAPAVKTFALEHGIEVLQPETVNTPEALDWIRSKRPDILAVVAYGEFLKKAVREICSFAPVNVHPSLLPDLRGAAPIQWALIRGYKISGVTTQFMVAKMDAGDVLLQEETEIGADESSADLFARLAPAGGRLLVETLDGLQAGKIQPRPQDESKATLAPLLDKALGEIHWEKSALEIHNLVRGTSPWPGAHTKLAAQKIKILKTKVVAASEAPPRQGKPGEFTLFGENLLVATGSGWLSVESLQPEGKRALLPPEFVNGIKGRQDTNVPFQFGT